MKKGYIFYILLALCLLIPLFFNNGNQNLNSDALINPSQIIPNNTNAYSTIGSPLNVIEYANRTDAAQPVTLRYNATSTSTSKGSAFATLPSNWQGNQISVNLYNLYENRCWNLNPGFNGPEYLGISRNISKVFYYGDGQLAAIKTDGLDKTFYMSFTLGKILGAATRDKILNRTLNWMKLPKTADILIIDDDGGLNYETYYTTSLTNLGYSPDAPSTNPNYQQIDHRNLVIWCTGSNPQISQAPLNFPSDLIDYLNQAGPQNIIVDGQYVGFCLDDHNSYNTPDGIDNNFYNNYLHANFLDYGIKNNRTYGFSGDAIGNQLYFLINGSGTVFGHDIITKNYRNNESLFYNWTSGDFGNTNIEENWFHCREKNGHGTNNDCVLLYLEDENNVGYDTGDEVWIEQKVSVNRSQIVWAGISFDYWAFNNFAPYTGSFNLYVSINGTVVYSKSFADIPEFQQWMTTGMVPINIAPIILPNIKIKIGLKVTYGINYNPDIKPMMMIDNFKLYLQTKVLPATVNLKMDGLTVKGGLGYGNCILIPAKPWDNSPVRVNFSWTPSPTPNPNLDIIVTFKCDTNLFASKTGQTLYTADPSKKGSLLETDQGTNTSWSFQYYINLPNGYWNHSFRIFHPADWVFSFVSEPQFPIINKKNQCYFGRNNITIPATFITNVPDGYWRFEAKSPNYIKNINPQIYSGTQWLNSTAYYVTNCTRIIAFISNGTGPPPNLPTSSINLSILNPNNQLWYSSKAASYLNGWAIFPNLIIFGANSTGGLYHVSVAWNNGMEAGYRKSNFTIIHDTQLILSKPTDAVVDQRAEINYGELLLIRVGLNDTNRNELVKGVNIRFNWTLGGSPTQINLNDLGTGQYETVLDTNDLPSIDNYTIIIKSYSNSFKNASYILNLVVTAETLLSSPQYPKIIAQWGQNLTIQVNYRSAIGEIGLNNSYVRINWTLGPHSVTEIGNGRYEIEINLSYAALREYSLSINVTRPNCASKTMKIALEVTNIGTELTSASYPRVITEWAQNYTIIVDYHTLSDVGINNSQISVNWTIPYYSVTGIGKGLYNIELNTSWCRVQDYILKINASKACYQTKILLIIIRIENVETELISDKYPRILVDWSYNTSITVNYRTILDSKGINNSLIMNNWTQSSLKVLGNGYYRIDLNTSLCQIQEYIIEIRAFKQNYQNKSLHIIIDVNALQTELISDAYPHVIGIWGQNLSITVNYRVLTGLKGIENALITSNWTSSSVRNPANGLYEIILNTSGYLIKEYLLQINAFAQYYYNKTLRIMVQIDAIQTELTSIAYPRIMGSWNSNITFTIDYHTIKFQGINASLISINWTLGYYSIIPLGNGLYRIKLNTSRTNIQDYLLNIRASKLYHQNKSLSITIEINAIETELISDNYPLTITEWNYNITININFRTILGLKGISNAILTVNWSIPYYSISESGNGFYQIKLNTSWCNVREYFLAIGAAKLNHYNKTLQIKIRIEVIKTELISDNYPRVIEGWNLNSTIIINYRAITEQIGINGALISGNWTYGYYNIIDIGNGLYQMELNTSWCLIGKYKIEINASKLFHQTKTLRIMVEIIPVDTELVSDNYPRVIGGWNLNSTIVVNYRAAIGLGIINALISVNWTQNFYNIIQIDNGLYQIELNTSCCFIGTYRIEINASKLYYQSRTLGITVEITAAETDLISPNFPRAIGEYNRNLSIYINYRIAGLLWGVNNSIITINWTLRYYSIHEQGNGIYQIVLNTSLCGIDEYLLEIHAAKYYHQNKTLRIIIEINFIETELTSEAYPRLNIEWSKNATIDLSYYMTIGSQGILGASISLNWTSGYYSIASIGIGLYRLKLNTSWTIIHQYLLEINVSKQYYVTKMLKIKIEINPVETILSYKPIDTIPYGENGTIYLKYTNLGGVPITEALISVNATYTLKYNYLDSYPYKLTIATYSLSDIALINITAIKLNYRTQTIIIALPYRSIFTSLTTLNQTLITLPVEELVHIFIIYNNSERAIGIPGANISFYGYSNIIFQDLGAGCYQINIATTTALDAYTILITTKKAGYMEKSIQFVVQIKQWLDFTSATISSDLLERQVGDPAYFSVVLQNEFTGEFFKPDEILIFYSWGSETGNLNYNGNGNYSFVLNTAGKAPGTYTIMVNATTKSGHLLMSQTITIVIKGQPLSWYETNSWIFGVAGALSAILAGYTFRNRWRQRNWEKKVKHIYILTKTGIPLYDKRLGGVSTTDASLVTSALIGISSIVQEIVQSKRALKTIDHMDNKILFQYGFQVITAVLASTDLPIIRRKLAQLTIKFEDSFKKELDTFKGEIDKFQGANKIINEFFPIEEYLKDQEISIEWTLERLFDMYGVSGIVTLLTIELGLKTAEKIAAGTGIEQKKIPIILRTLQDLMLIDSEVNLTARGKKAIAIYKEKKETYLKIQKLATQRIDVTKTE